MPNTMQRWTNLLNDSKPIQGYYVYGWVCEDWGGIYFYIGKGVGDRYKATSSRSMAFSAILKNWNCFPVILIDGLTEEEAFVKEEELKKEFTFKRGLPIMDGERKLATMACITAKEHKRKTDPNYKEGRKRVEYNHEKFKLLYREVKSGTKTKTAAARKLGVSRAKWYRIVNEIEARA